MGFSLPGLSPAPQMANAAQSQLVNSAQPNSAQPYGQQVQDGKVFRFGGQNAVTADQANASSNRAETRLLELGEKKAELQKKIGKEQAWLDKDWHDNKIHYVMDSARLFSTAKEADKVRAEHQTELDAAKEQLKLVNQAIERNGKLLERHTDTELKALDSNVMSQNDRLKQNKADNIVAANQNRGAFAF